MELRKWHRLETVSETRAHYWSNYRKSLPKVRQCTALSLYHMKMQHCQKGSNLIKLIHVVFLVKNIVFYYQTNLFKIDLEFYGSLYFVEDGCLPCSSR